MGDRAAKTALFDEFARVGKALASGRRIELLDVLANGERTVEGLAREAGLSVANTSQHLQVLRQAGLVATRREGTSVHCRLAAPEVFALWRALRTLAGSRLAEVERLAAAYLGARDELEPLTREELARQCRTIGYDHLLGELAGGMAAWRAAGLPQAQLPLVDPGRLDHQSGSVLDVRQASEVADGHLPDAVPVELGTLAGGQVPSALPEGPVTVMCGHGERAMTAASLLERAGRHDLRVLVGGPDDWARATGRPLVRP